MVDRAGVEVEILAQHFLAIELLVIGVFQVGVVIGRGRENGLVFERFRLNRLVVFDFAGGDEASPNPIFPFGRPDCEATPVAGLGMADASFEPEPRVFFTVSEFVDREPAQIHSAEAFGLSSERSRMVASGSSRRI